MNMTLNDLEFGWHYETDGIDDLPKMVEGEAESNDDFIPV